MKTACLIIFGIFFITQASFAQNELPEKFTDGLKRAKMTFNMPEGYTETDIIQNPHMSYEYAIKHNSEKIEIRYAIRPMDEMLRKYEENEIKMHPNKILQASVIAVSANINISGSRPNLSPFNADAVNKEFNADKGWTVLVEARQGFDNGYKYCLMVSIFKENLGTAFYFYMADDPKAFIEILPIFHSLKFE